MRTLIFDDRYTGHHTEYLHYLWEGAISHPNQEFVFAIPEEGWKYVSSLFQWEEAPNIKIRFLAQKEIRSYNSKNKFTRCLKSSLLVKRIAKDTKSDRIFMITLATVIPFLPLILPSSIRVSGILYKLYFRMPKTLIRGILEFPRYSVMAYSNSIDSVYLLNDLETVKNIRGKYLSHNFKYLCDPIEEQASLKDYDFRNEFGIPETDTMFLHFGAMNHRKGTLVLLDAITTMAKSDLADRTFVFLGKINPEISEDFYKLYHTATDNGAKIMLKDEFCKYELINSACKTTDCIIIPYLNTNQSSGLIGHAAIHRKPVIGPGTGLIGNLISEYNLGLTLPHITTDSIAEAILQFKPYQTSNHYIVTHSKEEFIKTIFDEHY